MLIAIITTTSSTLVLETLVLETKRLKFTSDYLVKLGTLHGTISNNCCRHSFVEIVEI